jgi:hypothetical protein
VKQLCAAGTAIILTLALAACGSSSSTSSAASGSTSTAGRQQARLALAQCLRAHGVNVPDPGSGGTPGGGGGFFRAFQNIPQAQLQSARQACSSQLAAAFPRLNLSPAQQAQLRAQLVKFAECMRSHGIDIPDPQAGAGAGAGGFGFRRAFGSVARNSPAFRTALTACQSLRPRFGRGGGPGAGPGA